MMYFVIIFASPLYFLMRQRWLGFFGNSMLWLLAWMTIWFAGFGMIFWLLGVGHATWHLRKELMLEQATMIAEQMTKQSKG